MTGGGGDGGTTPRLLTLIGSGESAPTMVKVHRWLIERVGGGPAVMLDTPFGFQANADDLVGKAQTYFRDSVGTELGVATYRSADTATDLDLERALTRIREASYVFAGPGSPTYALRQWAGSRVAEVLRERLQTGGAVTFSSAAALTIGVLTVPVYEIYKVGEAPHWLPGLDLLSVTGLKAAVIPHYDNAEGGRHDTRYCYLGESRLAAMEADLPDDVGVLGIDEHTAVTFDLDADTATVVGNGGLTARSRGRSTTVPSGTVVTVDELAAMLTGDASRAASGSSGNTVPPPISGEGVAAAESPARAATLAAVITDREGSFGQALADRDVTAAVAAALDLEGGLEAWSQDSLDSDERERGRSLLRSMLVRLGELAETGAADPREVVAPYVDLLLTLRASAREDRRWADSDQVRDGLAAAGVEVRDTTDGVEWDLRG
ncbi:MAG TPA: hypothetical protein VNB94_02500 [Mycobacteriales bacterium]|nr:hypothetical protein [Mycobacteriales bacterium]